MRSREVLLFIVLRTATLLMFLKLPLLRKASLFSIFQMMTGNDSLTKSQFQADEITLTTEPHMNHCQWKNFPLSEAAPYQEEQF